MSTIHCGGARSEKSVTATGSVDLRRTGHDEGTHLGMSGCLAGHFGMTLRSARIAADVRT
jgi:hypothetical protein